MYNKSLHWIFTPLRFVKTSEFRRYGEKGIKNKGITNIKPKYQKSKA